MIFWRTAARTSRLLKVRNEVIRKKTRVKNDSGKTVKQYVATV
jgi:hypothetical protein